MSQGPGEISPDSARAYNTLSDRMYELEARSVRAAEALRGAMASWGDATGGSDPAEISADTDRDRELRSRLEEEMALWHEENGWSSPMPERARLELIRSIKSEMDAGRRP